MGKVTRTGTYLTEAGVDSGTVTCEFKPVSEIQVGDRLVGGVVTGIRYSKSGKSVWFTMRGNRGEFEWPRESTAARTAVFTGADA